MWLTIQPIKILLRQQQNNEPLHLFSLEEPRQRRRTSRRNGVLSTTRIRCLRTTLLCILLAVVFVSAADRGSEHTTVTRRTITITNGTTDEEESDVVSNGPKIVNGQAAQPGQYPYYVKGQGCGAVLIWYDVIVSAGQCKGLLNHDNGMGVLVGASAVDASDFPAGVTTVTSQWRTIVDEIQHPDFDERRMQYDFMVAKLDRPLTLAAQGGNTPPLQDQPSNITFPFAPILALNKIKNKPKHNKVATIMGFGDTSPSGGDSLTLQTVELSIMGPTLCQKMMKKTTNGRISMDKKTMICAYDRTWNKNKKNAAGACQGDGGGPLVWDNKLVGLVSWGLQCKAATTAPNIYSRIAVATKWIQSQVCYLSAHPPDYCFATQQRTTSTTNGDKEVKPFPYPNGVRVDFQYDLFVHETAWQLIELPTQRVILDYPKTTFEFGTKDARVTVDLWKDEKKLLPNTNYQVKLLDGFGDGLQKGAYLNITYLPPPPTPKVTLLSLAFDSRADAAAGYIDFEFQYLANFTTPSFPEIN